MIAADIKYFFCTFILEKSSVHRLSELFFPPHWNLRQCLNMNISKTKFNLFIFIFNFLLYLFILLFQTFVFNSFWDMFRFISVKTYARSGSTDHLSKNYILKSISYMKPKFNYIYLSFGPQCFQPESLKQSFVICTTEVLTSWGELYLLIW